MANKSEKSNKLKARLPRGLSDRGPAEIAATRSMIDKIRAVYELYGFEPLETPDIEYTDALGKFLPDQDRPNEGVFSFQDDDEQWLSLRYDLTAPLARYVAENFDTLAKPYRSYRVGNVFRNEKPGPGRFRQFMQFDADTVGSSSPAADAEMCMMAADTMEKALGIPRGSYVVKVNNRKVLDGVLDSIDLDVVSHAARRLTAWRAIDKLDRLGEHGVRQLLGPGRKDESGDFTKGAGLDEEQINTVLSFILPQTPSADRQEIGSLYTYNTSTHGRYAARIKNNMTIVQGVGELQAISELVKSSGYGIDRVRIDQSVVRGLEYYTGPVFEVELTFTTDGKDGSPRFGSVGGGGRYDGLVSRFRGEPVPATGFSIGVSRLLAALEYLGKVDLKAELGPVVVAVFPGQPIDEAIRIVNRLRKPDDGGPPIRAELYLGNPRNLGNQFKYADRRNAPCVIVQGPDEKANKQVTIKDLVKGTEAALFHGAVGTSRDKYLEKREAQYSVSDEFILKTVREILARQARLASQ
jgi:histidyl-tRNA synthetase